MLNTKVSEQLQIKSDLTVKIAMDTARQVDIDIKQTRIITDDKHVYSFQKEARQRNYGGQQQSTITKNLAVVVTIIQLIKTKYVVIVDIKHPTTVIIVQL